MERFTIAQDVAHLLPNMQIVIVAAYNLPNKDTNAQVAKFAEVGQSNLRPTTKALLILHLEHPGHSFVHPLRLGRLSKRPIAPSHRPVSQHLEGEV